MFRALAARAMCLSLDRPDAMFSSKELCRDFASPTNESVERIKHLVRYLANNPRVVWQFRFEDLSGSLDVYSDTEVCMMPEDKEIDLGRGRAAWEPCVEMFVEDPNNSGPQLGGSRADRHLPCRRKGPGSPSTSL